MSETPDVSPPPSPTEAARREYHQARATRHAAWKYIAVGVLSVAAGVGGTLLALRYYPMGPAAVTMAPAAPAASPPSHEGMAGMGEVSAQPPGGEHPSQAAGKTVYISPARQQLIGVRTAQVEHRALDTTLRTTGVLAYDETRMTQVHTKIAGWVERLFVDFVGKPVRRGQPLFTIYSPELVSTQNEYLLARKAHARLAESRFEETREGAAALLAASRDRLKLWDISEAQIEQLEQTGTPRKSLTLYSPFNGIVLERNTFAGQYVTPEMTTFKIADLSTVWAIGQIFEYESRLVKVGQEVAVEFPYQQATRTLKGRITFIYPDVDPMTRRLRVRAEFVNPGLELRPDTFVTLIVEGAEQHQLAVPAEAVIDTGATRYAILAHPNGYFEPREIQTGAPLGGYYPVLQGLEQGDQVVTSAQFLIDSETNLQSAMQAMAGHGHGGMEQGGGGHEGMEMPAQKPPASKDTPVTKDMPAKEPAAPKAPSGAGEHSGHQSEPAKKPEPPKGSSEHSGHTPPAGHSGHEQ